MRHTKFYIIVKLFVPLIFAIGCNNSTSDNSNGAQNSIENNEQTSLSEDDSGFQILESALTKIWEINYQSANDSCIFELKIRIARVGGDPKTPVVIYSRNCGTTVLGERIDFALTGNNLTQVHPLNTGIQTSTVTDGHLLFQTDYGNDCLHTIDLSVNNIGDGKYHESWLGCADDNFSLDADATLKCTSEPDQLSCN